MPHFIDGMQSHDFEFTRRGDGKDYAMTSSDNTACVAIRSWSNSFVEQFVRGAVRSWSTSFGSSSFGSSLFGLLFVQFGVGELSGKKNPFPPNLYSVTTLNLIMSEREIQSKLMKTNECVKSIVPNQMLKIQLANSNGKNAQLENIMMALLQAANFN